MLTYFWPCVIYSSLKACLLLSKLWNFWLSMATISLFLDTGRKSGKLQCFNIKTLWDNIYSYSYILWRMSLLPMQHQPVSDNVFWFSHFPFSQFCYNVANNSFYNYAIVFSLVNSWYNINYFVLTNLIVFLF